MFERNAQIRNILLNDLCPKEFNKNNHVESEKEMWDTLVELHEGTEWVQKLDVLQCQLDKLKTEDGEGVVEMYSRLALYTNDIVGLGSEEITDKSIMKKILRILDRKYDTM